MSPSSYNTPLEEQPAGSAVADAAGVSVCARSLPSVDGSVFPMSPSVAGSSVDVTCEADSGVVGAAEEWKASVVVDFEIYFALKDIGSI